jgi:hypothetical protein
MGQMASIPGLQENAGEVTSLEQVEIGGPLNNKTNSQYDKIPGVVLIRKASGLDLTKLPPITPLPGGLDAQRHQ